MIQRILALAAGFLVVATLGGWGQEHSPSGPYSSDWSDSSAAAQAVRAVTSGRPDAVRQLPADFPEVMGYRPTAAPTGPTRANGGCSSPFGGTRYHFTADCRQHDLGYDLLRYAEAKGRPLGPWARKAVDERFAEQTRARCDRGAVDGLACRSTSDFYTAMVDFNSWRQGYGTPVVEPLSRLVLPVVAGLVTAILLALLPISRLWKWMAQWISQRTRIRMRPSAALQLKEQTV